MAKKTKAGRPKLADRLAASLDELRRHFNGEKTGVVVYPPGVPPKLVRAIYKAVAKREKRGLSVADVALAVGVPESRIGDIEKCRLKAITVEVLDGYAKAVGVELRFSVGAAAKTK
jgi:ribosome-binding protein aMBF1 (putative translation factor)